MDFTGRLDWFSNRYVQYGVSGQYRWLNRFLSGSVGVSQQCQSGGGRRHHASDGTTASSSICRTSLNFNLNYASNSSVIRRNAIDPLQNTQQITSSLNSPSASAGAR